MGIADIPVLKRFWVRYEPNPTDRPFLERAQTQDGDSLEVTVAVLDARESERFFGVALARRSVQPVWLRVVNRSTSPQRLRLVSIDPNYFTPLEAAAANHFSTGKRLLGFGLLAWLFLPLLLLMPLKIIGGLRANRRMDEYFQEHAFHLRPIPPGGESSGFVFTPLDAGTKVVHVCLVGHHGPKEFVFSIPVPGLAADYLHRDVASTERHETPVNCDEHQLRKLLSEQPRAVGNAQGTREGDPVNLVVIGEFATLLSAFGARWDPTEVITLATCWKTVRAFLLGSEYRYSPVSPLFLYGRCQDFALQRVRQSINERLHLRLWATPMRFREMPVWVGQISRDIGVRFTLKTWNLTTHRIDPDVDEARDYVVEDLLEAERIHAAAYVDGVGACDRSSPRRNLTGDPYFTDGKRAVIVVAEARTKPRIVEWV